jgi:hypothetical protein
VNGGVHCDSRFPQVGELMDPTLITDEDLEDVAIGMSPKDIVAFQALRDR